MRIVDYLDKGASLGPDRPCLTTDGQTLSYRQVQELTHFVSAALAGLGVAPGEKVAVLSGNDPVAFACVLGLSRAGAVWCPINPRNEAAENRELLALFDCSVVVFQAAYAELVARIREDLPLVTTWVCLDGTPDGALGWDEFLAYGDRVSGPPADAAAVVDRPAVDDLAAVVGTGGTTGRPKGVMLSGRNLETMTALTLMSYPFRGRPVYLALAPLTHRTCPAERPPAGSAPARRRLRRSW